MEFAIQRMRWQRKIKLNRRCWVIGSGLMLSAWQRACPGLKCIRLVFEGVFATAAEYGRTRRSPALRESAKHPRKVNSGPYRATIYIHCHTALLTCIQCPVHARRRRRFLASLPLLSRPFFSLIREVSWQPSESAELHTVYGFLSLGMLGHMRIFSFN